MFLTTVDIWGSETELQPSEKPGVVVRVMNAVYRHKLLEWLFCNPGVSSTNSRTLLTEKIQQLFK